MDHFGQLGAAHRRRARLSIFRLAAVERSSRRRPACRSRSRSCSKTCCAPRTVSVVRPQDIEALANWDAKAEPSREIAFTPARVLLQDFTGVPAVVDLAAMRDAMQKLGGDPKRINPLLPVELVIDHSVQVDEFGSRRRLPAPTPSWSSSATASATPSCAGARRRFATSGSCRRTRASSTR